jgi:exonuclease III
MFHAEDQQSFFGRNTKYKYQDDHLFVSENLKEQLISCDVLDYEPVRRLSDHSPVLMNIGTA